MDQPVSEPRMTAKGLYLRRFLWMVVLFWVYVASIGPVTWMASRRMLTDNTTGVLQIVYRPLYWTWHYGPDCVDSMLFWYTTRFDTFYASTRLSPIRHKSMHEYYWRMKTQGRWDKMSSEQKKKALIKHLPDR